MKKLINLPAHKLIIQVFLIPTSVYVMLYEFILSEYPAASEAIYKLGIITSRIAYSFLAASVFYLVSQYIPVYLPRQKKKIKVLSIVFQKTNTIKSIITAMEMELGLWGKDIMDNELVYAKLSAINPQTYVADYSNWYEYLYSVKNRLMEVIRSITLYNEFLSTDFLHELLILEERLLTPHVFEGRRTLACDNLTYAAIALQELLVHNMILQKLKEKQSDKYVKQLMKEGEEYKQINFLKQN